MIAPSNLLSPPIASGSPVPFLKLIRGGSVGREMPVAGSRVIIGRHPQCEVVLDNAAISRQHAQILQVGSEFFLEDLTSRNGTYLNGCSLDGRTRLQHGDELQLSDMQLLFCEIADADTADDSFEIRSGSGNERIELNFDDESDVGMDGPGESKSDKNAKRPSVASNPATDPIAPIMTTDASEQLIDSGNSQFVIPMLGTRDSDDDIDVEEGSFAAFELDSSSLLGHLPLGDSPLDEGDLDGQPLDDSSIRHRVKPGDAMAKTESHSASKLKAVLEIAQALTRVLEIDEVLPRTLQTLFRIFPQAEQGYILLQDAESGRLKVKASQARKVGRRPEEADHVAVSMTVVRRAMTTGEALLSANALDDTRFQASTSLSQLRIRSILCAPLMVVGGPKDGTAIGVIQIDTRQAGNEFTEDDLELLAAVAAQVAQAVENAQMHEQLLARREIERDLEFANQVQRGFLPNERPRVEGYSFSDYYEAAKSVGGDYYDYIRTPDDRIAIVLGDVAGKGVSAALLMARLYSSSRYQFLTTADPGEAVTRLNADIVDSGMGARFITFVAMLLDWKNNTLTLVNAGHMPPLLRTPEGEVMPISGDVSSVPLGILPDQTYRSMTIDFPKGSSVLAFTDGITEALSSEREMYGKDRLTDAFTTIDGDIGDAIRGIVKRVDEFSEGTIDRDDTCLVGFRRRA